ncbi:TPA: phage tail protein [Escherichia coli]|nr:phage tail protein [Escherichia coli]HCS7011124.1 phage tail protein [Escherichia coli]
MNVNKKKLADIFGVDVRTITAWQSQGLPITSNRKSTPLSRRRPNSILKAGQHRYQRAFIQRLNNGRWHVMQRLPQARYEEGNDDKGRKKRNRLPIQVVKIPMAAPLKQAFDENVDRIRRERLPKELAYALKQQLRIAIKR